LNPIADPDDRHNDAIAVVKHIAAGTGFDTIAKISANDLVVSATIVSLLPLDITQPDYGTLLRVTADLERRYPNPDSTVFACALILPERDIAYLHDSSTAQATDVALTVGPNPHDDPATREAARTGLSSWMDAIRAAQQPQRPVGHPFLNHPRTPADRPPTRPAQDYLNSPRLNGNDHSGPHR
jgi:hypothetical protein